MRRERHRHISLLYGADDNLAVVGVPAAPLLRAVSLPPAALGDDRVHDVLRLRAHDPCGSGASVRAPRERDGRAPVKLAAAAFAVGALGVWALASWVARKYRRVEWGQL